MKKSARKLTPEEQAEYNRACGIGADGLTDAQRRKRERTIAAEQRLALKLAAESGR